MTPSTPALAWYCRRCGGITHAVVDKHGTHERLREDGSLGEVTTVGAVRTAALCQCRPGSPACNWIAPVKPKAQPVRRQPYTAAGIRRVPCIRCGGDGATQWQICADGRSYRVLCRGCDLALNKMVMEWAKIPDWRGKLEAYEAAHRTEVRR